MQEEMTRAQDSTATNYATTAQAALLHPPKPPVPTQSSEGHSPTLPPTSGPQPIATQSAQPVSAPVLLPAFGELPWKRDGLIQTRRGAELARPVADALSPALFTPT